MHVSRYVLVGSSIGQGAHGQVLANPEWLSARPVTAWEGARRSPAVPACKAFACLLASPRMRASGKRVA